MQVNSLKTKGKPLEFFRLAVNLKKIKRICKQLFPKNKKDFPISGPEFADHAFFLLFGTACAMIWTRGERHESVDQAAYFLVDRCLRRL